MLINPFTGNPFGLDTEMEAIVGVNVEAPFITQRLAITTDQVSTLLTDEAASSAANYLWSDSNVNSWAQEMSLLFGGPPQSYVAQIEGYKSAFENAVKSHFRPLITEAVEDVFGGDNIPKLKFKFGARDEGGHALQSIVNDIPGIANDTMSSGFSNMVDAIRQHIEYELPPLSEVLSAQTGLNFILSGGSASSIVLDDPMILKRFGMRLPLRMDSALDDLEGSLFVGARNIRAMSGFQQVDTEFSLQLRPGSRLRAIHIDRFRLTVGGAVDVPSGDMIYQGTLQIELSQ